MIEHVAWWSLKNQYGDIDQGFIDNSIDTINQMHTQKRVCAKNLIVSSSSAVILNFTLNHSSFFFFKGSKKCPDVAETLI